MRTALVAGATGLVGGHCLRLLLADPSYSQVTALVRRAIELKHPKLKQVVVDFDRFDSVSAEIAADDIFSALGTTTAATKDRDRYYKIDVMFPAQIAAIGKANGTRQVLMVSSLGADPKSGQWYMKTKGEAEAKVAQVGIQSVHFFRPSFIAGRLEDQRLRETLALSTMRFCSFLFLANARRFLPLQAEIIAQAMIAVAHQAEPGRHTYNRIDMLNILGLKP